MNPNESCDKNAGDKGTVLLSPWEIVTSHKETGGRAVPSPLIPRMVQVGAGGYYPVAVPGVRLADGAAALHTDRGHSLPSLFPPLAAVGSLPLHSPNKSSKKGTPRKPSPCSPNDHSLACHVPEHITGKPQGIILD